MRTAEQAAAAELEEARLEGEARQKRKAGGGEAGPGGGKLDQKEKLEEGTQGAQKPKALTSRSSREAR